MKKIASYLLAWCLYWIGDWLSKLMDRFDSLEWLFPAYSFFMSRSLRVQDWGGCDGPWQKSEIDEIPEPK